MIYTGTSPSCSPPSSGQIRYNNITNRAEVYSGTAWVAVTATAPDDTRDHIKVTIGQDTFGKCEHWASIEPVGSFNYRLQVNGEVHDWVEETFGPQPRTWGNDRWDTASGRYYFKSEKDRDWMVVRWSS